MNCCLLMPQEASLSNWHPREPGQTETVGITADEVERREKPDGGRDKDIEGRFAEVHRQQTATASPQPACPQSVYANNSNKRSKNFDKRPHRCLVTPCLAVTALVLSTKLLYVEPG